MQELKLGTITLGDKILLTDPCYCYSRISNKFNTDNVCRKCVPGEWDVFFYYTPNGYRNSPKQLIAVSPQYDENQVLKTVKHKLAVDSATLGIFSSDTYPMIAYTQNIDDRTWRWECLRENYKEDWMAATDNSYGCGIIQEGAVSNTAHGDGNHIAELVMNHERKAVKAIIYL